MTCYVFLSLEVRWFHTWKGCALVVSNSLSALFDTLIHTHSCNYPLCLFLSFSYQGKELAAFCHISTAYVNSNKLGNIEEKLYPLDYDPDEV